MPGSNQLGSRGSRIGWIALVAIAMTACGGATPVATGSPSVALPAATDPPATPEATVAATPEASVGAVDAPIIKAGRCCMGEEIAAGTYRTPYTWLQGITIDVPAGWRVFSEDRTGGGVVALVRGDGNEIDHATEYVAFFPIPANEAIDAFVDDLRATQHLVAGPTEEGSVGGRRAATFDAVAEPNPDMVATPEIIAGAIAFPTIDRIYAPYKWRSETPEAQFRFVVVDHGEGGLLIYHEAPAERFDALAADATPIIDSVAFVD
jgi:hypothetical protein